MFLPGRAFAPGYWPQHPAERARLDKLEQERLARERQRPSIFYVCMSNGASVVAEACVAAGGYPALWRSYLAERCSPARPRFAAHARLATRSGASST